MLISTQKRIFDLLVAIPLVILVLPIVTIVAVSIFLTMGGPVLFRQTRVGLNESEFEIVKFRTMRSPKTGESMLLTDATRVTALGRFLRKTSLDELPGLWNVLKGEMSLVGPRPLLPSHLKIFTTEQRVRHQMAPGVTGLAQVSGRQNLALSQRVELDLKYVETATLFGDFLILCKTIQVVFAGTGVKTGQVFSDVDDLGLKKTIEDEGK